MLNEGDHFKLIQRISTKIWAFILVIKNINRACMQLDAVHPRHQDVILFHLGFHFRDGAYGFHQ